MYNNMTTNILKVIIKICYVGLAGLVILLWLLPKSVWMSVSDVTAISRINMSAITLTALSPAGYIALAFIDKLLSNVKKERIFDASTIRCLDVIAWCCVFAGLVCVTSFVIALLKFGLYIPTLFSFLAIALGALFMALILNVIKKVFQRAIELKQENDLTI